MNLFNRNKEPAMSEPEITGTQAIRARVLARKKRAHLARTAEDLGLSLQALEAFADGADNMPVAALEKLASEFYNGGVKYDAASDRLVDLNVASPWTPLIPDPWQNPDPGIAAAQQAYKAALKAAHGPEPHLSPRPEQPGPATSSGRPARRPGFAA